MQENTLHSSQHATQYKIAVADMVVESTVELTKTIFLIETVVSRFLSTCLSGAFFTLESVHTRSYPCVSNLQKDKSDEDIL